MAALPTDRFFFEGFLPPKQVARRARLSELAAIEATLVLFESGNRVQDTLADLAGIMGAREAAICRELTKLHEEVRRASLAELAAQADQLETRGEFVLVIGPPARDAQAMTPDALDAMLRDALPITASRTRWPMPSSLSGRPRREVYARALELAKEKPRWPARTRKRIMAKTDGADTPAKPASPARVAAFRTGLSAETRAAAYLMAKGYRILAKRFRTPHGEIDLVAKRRNLIAFVEVKARATLDDAAFAVTPRQQQPHHRRRPGLAGGASRACRIGAQI